jgi:hypothetical protein
MAYSKNGFCYVAASSQLLDYVPLLLQSSDGLHSSANGNAERRKNAALISLILVFVLKKWSPITIYLFTK